MADFESAPSELSTTLASDHSGLTGRLAEILGDAIQALIEDELSAKIGAEPGERSVARPWMACGAGPVLR
jgi:hypothetical protein